LALCQITKNSRKTAQQPVVLIDNNNSTSRSASSNKHTNKKIKVTAEPYTLQKPLQPFSTEIDENIIKDAYALPSGTGNTANIPLPLDISPKNSQQQFAANALCSSSQSGRSAFTDMADIDNNALQKDIAPLINSQKEDKTEDEKIAMKSYTIQVIDILLYRKGADVHVTFSNFSTIVKLSIITKGLYQNAYIQFDSPVASIYFTDNTWFYFIYEDAVRNSIASSGSMHENHVVNIQLHQVCQVITELQSMFRGFQDKMTALNRKVDDRIKNKLTPRSPIIQISATFTSIFIPITLQKLKQPVPASQTPVVESTSSTKSCTHTDDKSSSSDSDNDNIIKEQSAINGNDDEEEEMDYDPFTHDNEAGGKF
ncbi:hypothetical protein RhiirA4_475650, partial [Rhizophagus irregularis]